MVRCADGAQQEWAHAARGGSDETAGWRNGDHQPRRVGPTKGGNVPRRGGGEVSDAGGAGGSDQLYRRAGNEWSMAVRQPASGSDVRISGRRVAGEFARMGTAHL